jgi:uncharacterized protein (TIGR03067 family)
MNYAVLNALAISFSIGLLFFVSPGVSADDKLQGTWEMVRINSGPGVDRSSVAKVEITDSQMRFYRINGDGELVYKTSRNIRTNSEVTPHQMDYTYGDPNDFRFPFKAIYVVDGDKLVIASASSSDDPRPTKVPERWTVGLDLSLEEYRKAQD